VLMLVSKHSPFGDVKKLAAPQQEKSCHCVF
jgi:hypothetical protein